uniref:Arb2 domain-containing protein n=2 Tax=Ascaris TaxID=6251 RepID=F1L6Y3_ASCSU
MGVNSLHIRQSVLYNPQFRSLKKIDKRGEMRKQTHVTDESTSEIKGLDGREESNQHRHQVKSLADFGYHFDKDGVMRDKDGKQFVFTDQQTYEAIGEAVTEEVYNILERAPYNLCKTHFGTACNDDENSFIFHTKDFDKKEYMVVLIHGRGVVRAGQWARRLIMNESLDRGSQLPYLRECSKRGWGVLVMNTNHNTFIDRDGRQRTFEGSGSAVEHGINVWKQFVMPSKARCIAVVAHSAGGIVISNIIEEPSCWMGDEGRTRVGCICLTDSFFKAPSLEKMGEGARPCIRHWVAHPCKEIGVPLPPLDDHDVYVERVTAGTNVHEETSPVAIDDIFRFIETIFRKFNG